ncbi:MAG: hypothetical protein AAFQ34_15980 [Pseudomonadota bacterium]
MAELAARGLHVSMRTAARIFKKWRDHTASVAAAAAPVGRERRGRTGRPPRLTTELGKRIIELQDEHHGKASERKLCGLLAEEKHQVAPSTMNHWCKAMGMHVFKRPLQPSLTLNHKIQRLKFVLGQLERGEGGEYKFPGWNQHVHVGEKWFFLKQDKQAIRLFPCPDGTNEPPRDSVPHKSQMPKVMFLSAIAMPRSEYGFDGKLGLWPFVCERLAGRSHAATGTVKGQTMILDDVPVNAATYQEIITCEGGVMDMIRAKMWWFREGSGKEEAGQTIFIQQDGAPAHTATSNAELFLQCGQEGGYNIQVVTQPAQSPDFKWNDLSFFRSLQSDVHIQTLRTRAEILSAVRRAFERYEQERLEACCLSLLTSWRGCLEA